MKDGGYTLANWLGRNPFIPLVITKENFYV